MKFVNDFATGSKVIRDEFPEFRNCRLVGDDSGWDNYAIRVDDEYLFRFPRRQESLMQIKQEAEVLEKLRARLPGYIEVPNYQRVNLDSDSPFVSYKMIQGESLTKELYANFSDEKKAQFVRNLVEFLHILHGIEPEECPSLERIDPLRKYQDFYRQVVKVCFKYLTPEEQHKTRQLFESYLQNSAMQDYTPVVVHNDLSENHILITEHGIGVIDFGDTCIFDPAIDLSWFYLFGNKIFQEIVAQYLAGEDANFAKRIRQFYVPIIPYYGVIFGEESNNRQLFEDELADLRRNLAGL